MAETQFTRSTGMTPRRLESLADGIFAIAMTLLILAINLPEVGSHPNIARYLLGQYANFWNFALSFILLALFWLNHSQQFHHIKKTSALTLWINIFILLFVVLIPYSTTLMNDWPNDILAEIFFNSNMFVLSSLLAFNWWYSDRKGYIEMEGMREHITNVNRKGLILPTVALVAILLSFIYPGWSTLAYLSIPFISYVPAVKKKIRR